MSNNPRAGDTGKPKWLQFFIVSYLLIIGYMYLTGPSAEEQRAAQEAARAAASQTTDTVTRTFPADSATTEPVRTAEGNASITVHNHPGELVNLRTNLYDINVDTVGAVINSWRLLHTGSQSFKPEENTTGVELIRRIPAVNQQEATHQNWPLEVYFKEQAVKSYEDFNHITWTGESIPTRGRPTVRLKSPILDGIRIEKTLSMPDNSYYGNFKITVFNETSASLPIRDEAGRGLTVRWGPGLVERTGKETETGFTTYDTAVLRDFEEVHVFRPELGEGVMEMDGNVQWAGVESKFFAALLIPEQGDEITQRQRYFFRTLVPNSYKVDPALATDPERRTDLERYTPPLVMELSSSQFDLPPNSSRTFEFGMYVGPKKHNILKKADDGQHDLQALMYSESWWWMRAIYLVLTDVLNWIHRVLVSNYGIAIMLLTVLVKLIVFPLVHRSIKIQAKSSAEMKRIKPHLEAINEKYKEDPQEKQRQTWKVYQEHGINPLGAMRSCLPILPQIPIFIGLYRIANDTIDLQGANFLWIKDLSQADHLVHFGTHIPLIGSYFNILPILVAFTQMLSSKIAMSRAIQNITDPNQIQMQKMMVYLIPIMVMVTMYHFPAGLMLYWMASNVWQIGQTLITNKILDREEEKHLKAGPPPRKAKKPMNPNSFMGKMMARAEEARKEMARREQLAKKGGAPAGKKRR